MHSVSDQWPTKSLGTAIALTVSHLEFETKAKCDATCECRGNEVQARAITQGGVAVQIPRILPSDQIIAVAAVVAACLALLREWSG